MASIWADAIKGRVLLCTDPKDEFLQGVVAVPVARVPKYKPDRTMDTKGRTILDQQLPNRGCPKEAHPPALQPRHGEVARYLLFWAYTFPGISILFAKKDVAEAFRWLWIALDDCCLFATDFLGKDFGLDG